ncbi:unnamed protein product (macronuclear) [Paramecium tetraurelia]|uniref:Uncharacterized protein n=1 Tax=Paramecium tetraurelia TaxID=5888 RepID=A0CZA5_PARTE|nr:uncharacterized protein GSPATT00011695001 [Paramecium tetraurelia]CAK76122.1 unnamed protein product [Paramecium tetraurelia]|eukprot:XP_001443519.1 hypothetical protein (macronuclear) [Paramecium tetraurelia strain d4-2]
MQYTSSQLIRNQTPEDLIQSYSTQKRDNVSTNSKMQTQIKHSIELLKCNLISRQTVSDFTNRSQDQLVYQLFQLQQKVHNSQKQFIKKELYLQEQILQTQKNFDKTMNLMKLKYQMQIDDLNSELKVKDEEIYSLNLQLQQSNLNKIEERLYSSQQKQKSQTSEYLNTESSRMNSQLKMPRSSSGVSKYQKELNRIKLQTAEFAQKFENEKNQIQTDIAILKNQKQVLQGYLNFSKGQSTDRSYYNSPIKLNSMMTNRQSSSSFGVKDYFSRKQ